MTAIGTNFARPTRSELVTRDLNDLNGRIPGADSRLRRAVLNGIGVMHAGGLDGAYGALDYVACQIMPDSADFAHLVRWAAIWGITPKEPTAAVGTVTGAGTTDVPLGTVMQRADGFDYTTTADCVIAAGVITCPVVASQPGSIGSADVGTQLSLVSPIAGDSSDFLVSGSALEGTDIETPASILSRLLARIQNPPKGGAPGDYVAWALSQPAVTRAWEAPLWMGLGTVGLFFVFDGRDDIFPLAGDITAMQTFIDSVAPETAVVYCMAPTPLVVAFDITLTPNTTAVQDAVIDELTDLFATVGAPGVGITAFQYNQAIGVSEGVTDATVTSPAGAITPLAYELPVLGGFTWA